MSEEAEKPGLFDQLKAKLTGTKTNYGAHFNTRATPQSEPIPGSNQVPNSAGGYSFPVDDWTRLGRFLILGSEGGSYYATEATLTRENAKAVLRCIANNGPRTVNIIVAVSDSGRAPKNDPAIFALAMCAGLGDAPTRQAALAALPQVCRIGTHLFHFAQYVEGFRGWGRGLRQAVGAWYSMAPEKLAYQAVKYQQRDGWSHRDLLRLTHAQPPTPEHQTIYHWIVKGWPGVGVEPHPEPALQLIWASERAKQVTSEAELVQLITDYRLPREAIPTEWLKSPAVWAALLAEMPMTAMIRNLATMTRVGLVSAGSDAAAKIVAELGSEERLRRARVHPLAILAALRTYGQGHGERGKATWTPVTQLIDALDRAFYLSFGNVESTGKRWLLALDVSGSMGVPINNMPNLSARDASAAMALITAATEPAFQAVAFQTELLPLTISPRQRLDDVIKTVSGLPFAGTDCAQPMIWALKNKVETDVFAVYTDSESWYGSVHPMQALRDYRDKMGIAAKLIVVAMTSNGFSIADPNDGGALDVVGFDTATPQVMGDFAR